LKGSRMPVWRHARPSTARCVAHVRGLHLLGF
jgi:hypothetical protein